MARSHITHNVPIEKPKFHIQEMPSLESGDGTNAWGNSMHGTYKQPWVQHDGVADPTGERKIG